MDINKVLAQEFNLRQEQVDNTVALLDDDKTIPFIARYRKEVTGSLDDQVIRELYDRLTYLRNLVKRQEEILAKIEEQGKLTDELKKQIEAFDYQAAFSIADTLPKTQYNKLKEMLKFAKARQDLNTSEFEDELKPRIIPIRETEDKMNLFEYALNLDNKLKRKS